MYNTFPYMMPQMNPGLGSLTGITSLFKKINWGTLLSNTQKTLNVMNQAIPLYYQVKPMVKNFKTLSRIGKEINNVSNNTNLKNNTIVNDVKQNTNNTVTPTFFL